jgi:hypothetical protein
MRAIRLATAMVALAAVGAAAPAGASASASTSASVTTWLGGQQSPAAMGSAAWSGPGKNTWQLDARAAAVPAGKTRILATWTGPNRLFKHGATLLNTAATLRDQPAPTSAGLVFTERYRICGKKCGSWQSGELDPSPYIDVSSIPPGSSEDGLGLTLTWQGGKASLHVEWRLEVDVEAGDLGTVQATVTG